jgi:hypothetical protein
MSSSTVPTNSLELCALIERYLDSRLIRIASHSWNRRQTPSSRSLSRRPPISFASPPLEPTRPLLSACHRTFATSYTSPRNRRPKQVLRLDTTLRITQRRQNRRPTSSIAPSPHSITPCTSRRRVRMDMQPRCRRTTSSIRRVSSKLPLLLAFLPPSSLPFHSPPRTSTRIPRRH